MAQSTAAGDKRETGALRAFLQTLAEQYSARGAVLLALNPADQILVATESFPGDLAGKRIPMVERFPQLADRGMVEAGSVLLPTIFTRWLKERPKTLLLHTLHLPGFDGYLMLCWPHGAPALQQAALQRAIRGLKDALTGLIERHRLAEVNQRLKVRLDAILNNVSLGIASSDEEGRAHLNPIAAQLLGLPAGVTDSAVLAEAMRQLRGQCEISRALDIEGIEQSDAGEYWMLPASPNQAARVIRSESHNVGDMLTPGRIWLFTDVTALWQSGLRLKTLNAQLQVREAELKRYAEDLETSRASIEEQAQQAVELAEELHLQKQELENSKRESDYLANHDPLTGLNNRRAFRHALQQMIDVARGTQGQAAVLFIDLDKFKAVNDTLGHDAGDQLLKKVAQILTDALRDTDLLARFGGDEFAIATRLPGGADLAKITGLAERIRQRLEIPVPAPSPEAPDMVIQVCGTIGIALYPGDATDIDALFICADKAMYKGKKAGRNRVVLYRDVAPVS